MITQIALADSAADTKKVFQTINEYSNNQKVCLRISAPSSKIHFDVSLSLEDFATMRLVDKGIIKKEIKSIKEENNRGYSYTRDVEYWGYNPDFLKDYDVFIYNKNEDLICDKNAAFEVNNIISVSEVTAGTRYDPPYVIVRYSLQAKNLNDKYGLFQEMNNFLVDPENSKLHRDEVISKYAYTSLYNFGYDWTFVDKVYLTDQKYITEEEYKGYTSNRSYQKR